MITINPSNGAFNVCYRVTFQDGSRVLVRFTALGRVLARTEKVEDEVAVMKYLAQHTSIPVSKVLGFGKSVVGPYIVMTVIEGTQLSRYLRHVAGDCHIESKHLNGGLEDSVFAKRHFSNAADYFEELALQHLHHLEVQRNDAVTDEADCRKKYIARCLFRRISRQISSEHCTGPFRLYCDDLRPENILVDASTRAVTGVVDWEFAYAAPVEFTYAAPWWLLSERPEDWESDITEFLARFMPRFRTFLEALRGRESRKLKDGSLSRSQCLSEHMERSLENGLFWICLASRHSSMFDEIYWEFIDPRYHGPFSTIEDRMGLLPENERLSMDDFVERKLQQARESGLTSHYSID